MKFLGLLLIIFSFGLQAKTIDETLSGYVKEFNLKPLRPVSKRSSALFNVGRSLFMTKLLSGNNNIACVDCHFPGVMTHDGLPLSIGEGAIGRGASREQGHGVILARNTPALFNLKGINVMFWDGRVSYDPKTRTFTTPVAELNGKNPVRKDITSAMTNAVAAQAIFPIADHSEMRGQAGTNEIANAPSEVEAWDLVVEKILKDPKISAELKAAFPNKKINIGHIGEALSEFQTVAFSFADTGYDRYLKGDKLALTPLQKKGMDVFFGKGKCGECHQGEHLSELDFDNIVIPQIGPGKQAGDDIGRAQWDSSAGNLYAFRVAPLRNVGVTAPYMHNGAFATLEEVIEHYDDVEASLRAYKFVSSWKNYNELIKDHDHTKDDMRLSVISDDLQKKLNFSEDEEAALLDFLKTGLTDKRLLNNIPGILRHLHEP
jgi:cytochrome c peroxidase